MSSVNGESEYYLFQVWKALLWDPKKRIFLTFNSTYFQDHQIIWYTVADVLDIFKM